MERKQKRNLLKSILLLSLFFTYLFFFNFSKVDATELSLKKTQEEMKEEYRENVYTEEYRRYLELSDEEKAKLNVIPEKYEYTVEEYFENKKSEPSFFAEITIPERYNLRDDITIKTENQGSLGLCWAFASNNAVETYLALNEDKNYDFSEMHVDYLTSMEFYNNTGKGQPHRDLHEGGNFSIFYEGYAINEYGPVLETEVPYVEVHPSNYNKLLNYKPTEYIYDIKRFPNFTWEKDLNRKEEIRNDVKKHIMTNGALYASICSYNIYNAYGTSSGDTVLNEQNLNNRYTRDHAITIIGWDDNYSKENFPTWCRPKNNGAYIALNSWGSYFGDDGVFYISYEDILVEGELSGITYVDNKAYSVDSVTFKDVNLYNSVLNAGYERYIVSVNPNTLTITAKEPYFKLLTSVYIYAAHDFTGLDKFTNIESLFVFEDKTNVIKADYSKIANLENLTYLAMGNVSATDWSFLKEFKWLEYLELQNVDMLDFSVLEELKNLKGIYIEENYNDDDLDNYYGEFDMTKLNSLTIFHMYLPDLQRGNVKLKNLTNNIETVYLDNVKFETDFLLGKKQLIELCLRNIDISNLNFITSDMNKLQYVSLENTNTLNIDALENLTQIIYVEFFNNVIPEFNNLKDNLNLKLGFYNCYKGIHLDKLFVTGIYEKIAIPEEILFFMNDYYTYYGFDPDDAKVKTYISNAHFDESKKNIIVKSDQTMDYNSFSIIIADEYSDNPELNNIASYIIYFDTKEINQMPSSTAILNYQTHIQNVGWQRYMPENETSGTEGKGYRLEGIKINLASNIPGGIEYTTHVQNIGWQDYVSNNEMSGTSGRGLRLEGIKIRLTGELADLYDVYYRVHIQNTGWLSWAKNDEVAGSSGYGFRLEGIQVVLAKKGEEPPVMYPEAKSTQYFQEKVNVMYTAHIENIGWPSFVRNGATIGKIGSALRIEGLKIKKESTTLGDIIYSTHVEKVGWLDFVKNGEFSGTEGRGLRVEGIKIDLTDALKEKYNIYYRVYVEGESDWQGWAKNGEEAGSYGLARKLEGLQVMIKPISANPPAGTDRPACLTPDDNDNPED